MPIYGGKANEHAAALALGGALFGTGWLGVLALLTLAGNGTSHPWFDPAVFWLLFAALAIMGTFGFYVMATPYTGWRMPRLRTPEEAIRPRQLLWNALRWLTRSPYKSMAADIKAMRAEVEQLKTARSAANTVTTAATPPAAIVPGLSVNTDRDEVRIGVYNPGPGESFFAGEIWLIEGSTGSYVYPLSIKWASTVGERALVPAGKTRYLELARIEQVPDKELWHVTFDDAYGDCVAISVDGPAAPFTVHVKVNQTSAVAPVHGSAHLTVRIDADLYFDRDGNAEMRLDAREADE